MTFAQDSEEWVRALPAAYSGSGIQVELIEPPASAPTTEEAPAAVPSPAFPWGRFILNLLNPNTIMAGLIVALIAAVVLGLLWSSLTVLGYVAALSGGWGLPRAADRQKVYFNCPFSQKGVKSFATACHHCGRDLPRAT